MNGGIFYHMVLDFFYQGLFGAVRQGNFHNGIFTGVDDFFYVFQADGNGDGFFMAAINYTGYVFFRADFGEGAFYAEPFS